MLNVDFIPIASCVNVGGFVCFKLGTPFKGFICLVLFILLALTFHMLEEKYRGVLITILLIYLMQLLNMCSQELHL